MLVPYVRRKFPNRPSISAWEIPGKYRDRRDVYQLFLPKTNTPTNMQLTLSASATQGNNAGGGRGIEPPVRFPVHRFSSSQEDSDPFRKFSTLLDFSTSYQPNVLIRFRVICSVLIMELLQFYYSNASPAPGWKRSVCPRVSCLDSSGSFNYATMTCDHTENHPYIPYSQRHPAVTSIAFLSGSVAACGLIGILLSRRQRQQ